MKLFWKKEKEEGLKRNPFTQHVINMTLRKQRNRCRSCKRYLKRILEADHIDANRSNNRSSNCQMLCPNCHAYKTKYRDAKILRYVEAILKSKGWVKK